MAGVRQCCQHRVQQPDGNRQGEGGWARVRGGRKPRGTAPDSGLARDGVAAMMALGSAALLAAFATVRTTGPKPLLGRQEAGIQDEQLPQRRPPPVRDTHDRRTLSVARMAMLFAFFAAVATTWQAISAQHSLSLQQDLGSRQLRAYVEVLDASALPVPSPGEPFVTRLLLKNAGQTPAYDLMAYNLIATVRVGEVDTASLVRRVTWPMVTSITLASQ